MLALENWDDVRVEKTGPYVRVCATAPSGRQHSGVGDDADEIAARLAAIEARLIEDEIPRPFILAAASEAAADLVQPSPHPIDEVEPLAAAAPDVEVQPEAPALSPMKPLEASPAGPAAYTGAMILEDEVGKRRNQVLGLITAHKHALLDARNDPSRRQSLQKAFVDYQNYAALGAPIPDDVAQGYRDFVQERDYSERIERHARSLEGLAMQADNARLAWLVSRIDLNWPGVNDGRSDAV